MSSSPVAALLDRLLREPGRPRLTWYGESGERIELSGAVLVNWVSKTTNMLVEELDAEPGVTVGLDLPVHWRTVVWSLGAWYSGATLHLVAPREAVDPDVVVTDRPHAWAGRPPVVAAVALPGLARRWAGSDPLPPGTIDAAADVMTYGDQVGYAPDVPLSAAAIGGYPGAASVPYLDLFGWTEQATSALPPGARVLVTADGHARTSAPGAPHADATTA